MYDAAKTVWDWMPQWLKSAVEFLGKIASEAGTALINFFKDPVGSIQGGLNWLQTTIGNTLAGIQTAIADISRMVWQALPQQFKDFLQWAGLLSIDIINGLITFIKDPVGTIQGGLNWLQQQIGNVLAGIQQGIADISRVVWEALPQPLKDFANTIGQIGTAVWIGLKVFVKDPVGAIKSGLDAVANNVISMVQNGISGLSAFLGEVLAKVTGALGSGLQMVATWLLEHLTWFGEMIVGAFNAVANAVSSEITSVFSGIVNVITGALGIGSPDKEVKMAVDSMVGTMWTRQMAIIKEAYKSPPTSEGIINASNFTLAMLMGAATSGLIAGAAIDLAHPFKEVMASRTVREIMWMIGVPAVTASIITLPSAIGLLIPLRYALMESLQPMQAGASDIVRFAVRETFDPDRRKELLQFYPGDPYTRAMAREGFSREWAEHFWGAHWVLPPLQALNDMLYRGLIDEAEYLRYVKYSDYDPTKHKELMAIIYPPWTRVDIRRMWEMGVITEDVMTREYRWGGYDQAHAELLTLWTKIYVAAPDLKARYKNGWISSEDMKAELVKLGMPVDRVDLFMETILPANKPERTSKEKDLTKTDILKLYRVGQIDLAAARGFLLALGYDDVEAGYLLALEAEKMTTELKDLTSSQILKAYRFEILTRDEANDKLRIAGWTEAAAETMLKLEDVNLADGKVDKMRERDLSMSQIIQAVGRGIIDLATGMKYLAYLGYSDWEIDLILKLEGLA